MRLVGDGLSGACLLLEFARQRMVEVPLVLRGSEWSKCPAARQGSCSCPLAVATVPNGYEDHVATVHRLRCRNERQDDCIDIDSTVDLPWMYHKQTPAAKRRHIVACTRFDLSRFKIH